MVSPGWLERFLVERGYKVIKWDTLPKEKYKKAPDAPGVYALYWGSTLQYIGMASSLYDRIRAHVDEVPFGSFAWFKMPKDQIAAAEAELIHEYDPPWNTNYPTHPDDYDTSDDY